MDNLIYKMQADARVCEENIELEEKNDCSGRLLKQFCG